MERVGQHCASRHKKDLGINVRKCDYCVQSDTHSSPDHLSLDATLPGISLAPASSFSPRPLEEKKKKVIWAGAGWDLDAVFCREQHVCASGAGYRKLLILCI